MPRFIRSDGVGRGIVEGCVFGHFFVLPLFGVVTRSMRLRKNLSIFHSGLGAIALTLSMALVTVSLVSFPRRSISTSVEKLGV